MVRAIGILLLVVLTPASKGQSLWDELSGGRSEIYFSINKSDAVQLNDIADIVYIDRIRGDSVYAYANQKQLIAFNNTNIPFTPCLAPSMKNKNPVMQNKAGLKNNLNWDFYPTYEAYEEIMFQFENTYPGLCELIEIGSLASGRKLLAIRITDNIDIKEAEPEFLFTATMHGDETTGFVLMLRLIDYLLTNYGQNDRITHLIDNIDLYINPLANPNGTYAEGNNTIYGATRTNANGIDINRNFPDPEDGPHPDGNEWQEETLFFMEFAEAHNFVMSANIHGGTEVCNYPWDTWERRHADDNWWQFVCREYADTAQRYSPTGYMEYYDNGITNGFEWYSISGGRQDYMNYFHQCREFTLEISNIKTPPAHLLPDYWYYNYRSFLNYLEQSTYGLRGIITDAETRLPLQAEITFKQHDIDSSMVFSTSHSGNYHRPAYTGLYHVKISAPDYESQYFPQVRIDNYGLTTLDVEMKLDSNLSIAETKVNNRSFLYPNPLHTDQVNFTSSKISDGTLKIYDLAGRELLRYTIRNESYINIGYLKKGVYLVIFTGKNKAFSSKLFRF